MSANLGGVLEGRGLVSGSLGRVLRGMRHGLRGVLGVFQWIAGAMTPQEPIFLNVVESCYNGILDGYLYMLIC